MSSKILAIAAIMAVAGTSILALVSTVPTYAKITPGETTCDGEPGECPGSSNDPGKGHDQETSPATNPAGNPPPGQNK